MDIMLYGFTPRALLSVWLMTLLCTANKNGECRVGPSIIECIFCTSLSRSQDHFCGDPLNTSHPDLTRGPCEGFCAKWVTELSPGILRFTRTCSTTLKMSMHKHMVCMHEGGSRHGHLCFCDEKECNAAVHIGTSWSRGLPILAFAIAYCLMKTFTDVN